MDLAGTPGADTVVPAEKSGDSAANLLPNAPGSEADRFDRGEIPIFKARWFGVFLLLPFLAIGDWLFERRSAQVQELLKSGKDQRTKDQNPRQGKS